jgi:hypothetical protein
MDIGKCMPVPPHPPLPPLPPFIVGMCCVVVRVWLRCPWPKSTSEAKMGSKKEPSLGTK